MPSSHFNGNDLLAFMFSHENALTVKYNQLEKNLWNLRCWKKSWENLK